jgi:hypothetical protein
MPRIGSFEPNNAFAPFVQNSPGPVSAPNIPNTGAPITEAALHGANTLANDAAESRNVVTNGILDVAGVTLQKVQEKVQRQQEKKLAIEKAQQTVINNTAVNNALSNWRVGTNQAALNIRSNPANTDSWVPQLQKTIDDGLPDFMAKQNLTKDQQAIFRERISEAQTPYILDMQNAAGEVGKAYTQHTISTRLDAQGLSGNQVKDMASLDLGIANIRDKKANQDVFDFYGPKADPMLAKTQEDYLANAIHANYANTGFVKDILKKYAPMLKGEQIEQFSKDADAQEQLNLKYADEVKTKDQYNMQRTIKDLIDNGNANIMDGKVVGSTLSDLRKLADNPLVKNNGALKDLIANGMKSMTVDTQKILQDNRQNAYFSAFLQGQARIATTFAQGQERFNSWAQHQAQLEHMSSPQATKANDEWSGYLSQLEAAAKVKDVKTGFATAEAARESLTKAANNKFITDTTRRDALKKINSETDTLNNLIDQKQPQKTGWLGFAESNEDRVINHKLAKPPEALFAKLGYKPSDTAKRQKATVIYRELNSTKIDSFKPYKDAKGNTHSVPTDEDFSELQKWVGDYMNANRNYYGLSE